MTQNYQAVWITRDADGNCSTAVAERQVEDLPADDVLVAVEYSSLNFKDMLSAQGHPGVTRNFPHQPGIDAAGVVVESSSPTLQPGDPVIVSGYDLGMGTPGGLGQYIRVPAGWVVPMPKGLNAREAMTYGTAGFTSALCIEKLLRMGAEPDNGTVAITGATGGVGTFAVSLLHQLGFTVAAATGKPDQAGWLRERGASEVFSRQELAEIDRPLSRPRFAHAVDTLGGEYLAKLLTTIDYGGSVACCGLAASPDLPATVMPFIIRDVNLLGVDCVEQPLAQKQKIWEKLGGAWKLGDLDTLVEEIGLKEVPAALQRIKDGQMVGRYLVRVSDQA